MKICLLKNNGKYEAQALMITMIVLVVSVVIGMAVYSRTLRDRQSVINEQESSEALEVSDSLIDIFSEISGDDLLTSLGMEDSLRIENEAQLKEYLTNFGVDTTNLDFLSNTCSNTGASFVITVKPSTGEYIEVRDDMALSFVLGNNSQSLNPNCDLSLQFEPRGTNSVGLVIQKIYGKNYPNTIYKEYEPDDMLAYCIHTGGSCDNERIISSDSWISTSSSAPMSIHLNEINDTYSLDEIRLLVVGGVLAVNSSLSEESCAGNFDLTMAKVSVEVNCNGVSRGKEVYIPRENNTSYSSVFDYAIYNDNGLLQPY